MWWHGDIEGIADIFGDGDFPAPTGPGDLMPVMRFMGLDVHESLYKYTKPIAELSFSALFEDEHGVGIVTDGRTILGTGFMCDARPYKS
jgi:hypothetical protein